MITIYITTYLQLLLLWRKWNRFASWYHSTLNATRPHNHPWEAFLFFSNEDTPFSSTSQAHHLAFPTLSVVLDDVFKYPLSNIGSANRIAKLWALFSARSDLIQANTVIDALAT